MVVIPHSMRDPAVDVVTICDRLFEIIYIIYKNLGWVGIGLFTKKIGICCKGFFRFLLNSREVCYLKIYYFEIYYLKIFLTIFLKILTTNGFSLRRVGISFSHRKLIYFFIFNIFIYKLFKGILIKSFS